MAEEEAMREALEDKVFRRRVKERLRELGAEGDPLLTRILQYLVTPKGMMTAGGALAAIAITLLVQFGLLKPSGALIQVNLGPSSGPTATAASVAGESVTSESRVRTPAVPSRLPAIPTLSFNSTAPDATLRIELAIASESDSVWIRLPTPSFGRNFPADRVIASFQIVINPRLWSKRAKLC